MDRLPPPRFTLSASSRGKFLAGSLLVLLFSFALLRVVAILKNQPSLASAQKLIDSWDFVSAEQDLQFLHDQSPGSPVIERAYGDVLLKRGELFKARTVFEHLVHVDTAQKPRALLNLGITQFFLGNLDSAEVLGRSIIRQSGGDSVIVARAFHLFGRIAFNRAYYDAAEGYQHKSLQISRAFGDADCEADALRQLGVLMWYKGRNNEAMTKFYQPALALYRTTGDKIGEATVLSNIGLIYADRGDWEIQLRYQLQAFNIRKKIGDQIGLVDSYYFLHYLPSSTKSVQAYHYASLKRSYELAKRTGYAWGVEVASRAIGIFFAAALKNKNFSTDWIDSTMTNLSGEGRILKTQSEARRYELSGDYAQAAQLYHMGVLQADSVGYKSEKAAGLLYYGNMLKKIGRFEEADKAYRAARKENAGQLWKDEWIDGESAELDVLRGNVVTAKTTLVRLTSRYDSLYIQGIQNGQPDVGFEQTISEVHAQRKSHYSALIELLSKTKDRDLFKYIEKERSLPFWEGAGAVEGGSLTTSIRELVNMLEQFESGNPAPEVQPILEKIGELKQEAVTRQSLLAKVSLNVHETQPPSVMVVQRYLEAREAYVAYSVAGKKTVVYAIKKHESKALELNINESELQELVLVYRRALFRGRNNPLDSAWRPISLGLSRLLLAPLYQNGFLKDVDRLAISPDGVLHMLPFQTLVIQDEPLGIRYLLENHVVWYVPSAKFLTDLRAKPRRRPESILAVAPQSAALRYSAEEIESIPASVFKKREVVKDSDAKAEIVISKLASFDALHFSSHARLNLRFPLYSSIACSDRGIELHEILAKKLRSRLIILSACESGLGAGASTNVPEGEDLVSFPRAFINAGADNVIASMWLVEDRSTAALMNDFYEILSKLYSPGKEPFPAPFSSALNLAQRQFVHHEGTSGAKLHPFYWGAFYLVGAE